jgi:hypothetical protein
VLTLGDIVPILSPFIGANQDAVQRINLVLERYLKSTDPVGSLERVIFVVSADANGQGFILLPDRYDSIRGAVEHPNTTPQIYASGRALEMRNGWYEYAPGNLGMVKGTNEQLGIIPIPLTQADNVNFTDSGLIKRFFKVPVCPTPGAQSFFTLICKRAFQFLEDDNAVLPVQNLGALKLGLKALDKEDVEDYVRASELWDQGKTLLAQETDNETGSEALGKVQMEDDFCLADLGREMWGHGWYGNWGNW